MWLKMCHEGHSAFISCLFCERSCLTSLVYIYHSKATGRIGV